jgi:hypothetical protein
MNFAQWSAVFPAPADDADVERILRFATGLVKLGEAEDVYRLEDVGVSDGHLTFVRIWKMCWEESGILPLFDPRTNEILSLMSRVSGRFSYYDEDGEIREALIGNVGGFLRARTTLEPFSCRGDYLGDVPPVFIQAYSVHRKEFSTRREPVEISISLHTDVWFPMTLALRDFDQDFESTEPEWHDNQALADRHTPRLNRFIASAHRLADECGGVWRVDPGDDLRTTYGFMVEENGLWY